MEFKRKSFVAFIVFVAGIISVACSVDNAPQVNFHLEYLPTDSINVPESMQRGHSYNLSLYYHRPNDCYYFNGFYYSKDTYTNTIAIESMVLNSNNCQPVNTFAAEVASFPFEVPYDGYDSYTFKFYKGVDENGDDTFAEIEIPVTE